MPTFAEARSTLEGSIAIARRDPKADRFFDLSADAFWRSFGAIMFIAPVYLIFVLAEARMAAELVTEPAAPLPGMGVLLVSEMVTLGLDWIAYPLAMYFITRQFGLGTRFVAYIIVYNWSSLLVALVMAPPFLLYAAGFLPAELTVLLNLMTVIAVLWYRWLLATEILGAPGMTAAGFVALDVVLSLFINLSIAAALVSPA